MRTLLFRDKLTPTPSRLLIRESAREILSSPRRAPERLQKRISRRSRDQRPVRRSRRFDRNPPRDIAEAGRGRGGQTGAPRGETILATSSARCNRKVRGSAKRSKPCEGTALPSASKNARRRSPRVIEVREKRSVRGIGRTEGERWRKTSEANAARRKREKSPADR